MPKQATKKAEASIADVACGAILEGASTKEVVLAVLAQFPESKFNKLSVGWYRNRLRADGKRVPIVSKRGRPLKKKTTKSKRS